MQYVFTAGVILNFEENRIKFFYLELFYPLFKNQGFFWKYPWKEIFAGVATTPQNKVEKVEAGNISVNGWKIVIIF